MKHKTLYKGYKIAWSEEGAGEVLVLLHGFCESSEMWAAFSGALQCDYRVICIDLPGFGASDLIAPYTIETLADAVHTVLAGAGALDGVLIGHSMGGYVAVAYAERYGERLRGLGLFHSHPYADSEEKRQNRQKSIDFIHRHGVAPFVSHLFSALFAPAFLSAHPSVVEDFIDACSAQQRDAVMAASRAMMEREDRQAVLAALTCPVLFIIGAQDSSIPLAQCLEQCSLPDRAQVCLLPDVGHMGMLEAAAQTLAAVRSFLEWVGGGGEREG